MHHVNEPTNLFNSTLQIYETYYPLAYKSAFSLLKNVAESEDIADKVMSELEVKLSRNLFVQIFRGLVTKMASCKVYEKWRKDKMKRGKRNKIGQKFQKEQKKNFSDPQVETQKCEEIDRLRCAISKLDLHSQGVVRLYLKLADDNGRVSYRLMARECHKAQWTVKNELENIFAQLATWMSYGSIKEEE